MTLLFVIFLLLTGCSSAQEIPPSGEQTLEQLTDALEAEPEDDSWIQELDDFKKHPLNLNVANKEELMSLRIINSLQADHLVGYRNLLGMLVSIYELQAVPGWDIPTIRKLLPFIEVSIPVSIQAETKKRFLEGQHQLLFRMGRIMQKSKGYNRPVTGSGYLGDPMRMFFRYRFQSGNLMQWGIAGEKDAGERFLGGAQNRGFDFYSAHIFIRKLGNIEALAIGDFTVNMGQGLVHWQGMAFKKSADIMHIKREAAVLRPYSSAGEILFHRGAGITIKKKNWETSLFASLKKPDANITINVEGREVVSSILTSGYHRSMNEIRDRNSVRQFATGIDIAYRRDKFKIGARAVAVGYSLPVQKRDEPYNKYAWSGTRWMNAGIDYGYTYRNIHVFGEIAMDKRKQIAILNGMLVSLSPTIDLSIVQRSMNRYQSVFGNAFTENTMPSNEKGLFAGIEIRPLQRIRITAYADVFVFPWLKYLVDAPSAGKEFLIQLVYTPNRLSEWMMRYRDEVKERNDKDNTFATSSVKLYKRQSLRMQFSTKLNADFNVRQRTELLWYRGEGSSLKQGFLLFSDFIYRPPLKPLSAVLRIAFFETSDYDSRVYAYENDVMYSYSIPALSGKGTRYYITLGYDLNRNWTAWTRWAATIFRDQQSVGTGQDEIPGTEKSEFKIQLRWQF